MATASAAPGKDGALVGKPRLVEKTKTVAVYDITYWSTGLKVKGMLFENRTAGKKKLPGVVFNHGGVDGIPNLMKQRCKELAARGYHVLAPSYRGEDGSEGEVRWPLVKWTMRSTRCACCVRVRAWTRTESPWPAQATAAS